MSKGDVPATRKDIDDVLTVIKDFSGHVDERFNAVDVRFDVVESEIRKNRESIQKNREDIRKILSILDSFAKRLEINEDERIVMGHQLDRLDKWTHELADKIGHKLNR